MLVGRVADVSCGGYEDPVAAIETVLGALHAAAGITRGELYGDGAPAFISGVKLGLEVLNDGWRVVDFEAFADSFGGERGGWGVGGRVSGENLQIISTIRKGRDVQGIEFLLQFVL